MATLLFDTNIVSFILRRDTRIAPYLPHLAGQLRAISFQTVAELWQWAEDRGWGDQRRARLEETLRTSYLVIPADSDLCKEWARVRSERNSMGRPMSESDAWIAATARHYGWPLVTNDSDFIDTPGLTLIIEPPP